MKVAFALLLVLGLSACTENVEPPLEFPTSGVPDYQLGGAYQPRDDVTVVGRDSTDPPLEGVYSICYLNAFQTQPQQADFWLDEHPELVLRDDHGNPVFDPEWPDEMALDTSTEQSRAGLASIIAEWIKGCRDSGYQAVEFDNLDSYSRFGGLTLDGNVALATTLVAIAHENDLDAGQKNTAELGSRGRDEIGFDFVISEECFIYDECGLYADVYGDHFIDVEYQRFVLGELAGLCADPDVPLLTIVRDVGLSVEVDARTVFWTCQDI